MDKLFALFMTAFLINNIILTKFLGMCPFLGVSRQRSSAIGMGLAVIFVILGASIFTYVLYYSVLVPLELEYMDLITFILVIAAFVQFVELVLKKYSPALYKALGIYLPLITTNCVVLYVTLENITNKFDFLEMIVYSIAVPAGFALMLFIFSTIRERLDIATTPKPFRGNALALVLAAIMALAFSGLAGLV
ncbi:MAG: electron transport complex subunit RsxA [Firmicutes bacterium GWF2_51_9]|jgi:electron transport complex protein RnfA|nr:MAG: electron transport complex subunit RsxA [Firmicutes bacterium GWF2_51_9]OGS59224.1 MAG: electron transport complex subunit RsxA [Firmicutes bacterium GWE2_51_13]HAM64091.1 electron transport complex subunit RsxA [Erysipelotrichaceae bacterium]HAO60367.1 electron transport complex subunit RsxA [Erysipelotrichaceae bacterium]HBZ41788.1 electron transport complex subunit RsxA [Erysipelotrichaceae bacterium]